MSRVEIHMELRVKVFVDGVEQIGSRFRGGVEFTEQRDDAIDYHLERLAVPTLHMLCEEADQLIYGLTDELLHRPR